MAVFGLIGVGIGRAIAPFVNDPTLEWQLGFLGAFDGLGVVCLVHALLFGSNKSRQRLHPAAVFLMFLVVGMKCGHGHGIGWLVFTGVANAIVACGISFAVVALLRRPTWFGR